MGNRSITDSCTGRVNIFDRPFLSLSSQTSWTTELRETRAGLATLEMLRTGKVWHHLKEIDEKRNPQCLDQAHKETCVIFFMKIGIKAAGWSFAASRVHYCSVFQRRSGCTGEECWAGVCQRTSPNPEPTTKAVLPKGYVNDLTTQHFLISVWLWCELFDHGKWTP